MLPLATVTASTSQSIPRPAQRSATAAHSAALSGLRPWSTVATSNWPGIAASASSSIARLSGPPDTARPRRPPSGQSRASASAKRAASASPASAAAGDLAPVASILLLEPPGRERRVCLAEFGERDAGSVGVADRDHRLGQEQQAVGRAGAVLVLLVVLEEVRRRLARLPVIEERPAEQVAAVAGPRVVRVLFEEQRQLLPRLGVEPGFPQAEAVNVLVLAGVIGLRLGDRLDSRHPGRARAR